MLAVACGSAAEEEGPKSEGFKSLLQAVVRLDVWETTYENGGKRTEHGVGSGTIMTKEGYVLTNAHVVNPYAERILVTLANLERVPARLVGWDHWTDLAVVQLDMGEITRRGFKFSVAAFGDSGQLFPGETVFAVGTPNGLARTVTRGIISNTERYFEGSQVGRGYETGLFNTWLQTDAAINPGNSGGPLVLGDGRVVGVNTRAYLGANNLGFAVPAETAKRVMEGLIRDGKVTRSYVGIDPGPLQDLENFYDLEANKGMLVQNVAPGSPAGVAGLRAGDIVLQVDGSDVDGRFPEQLPPIQNRIASYPVGAQIKLLVKRGDERLGVVVKTEPLESRVGEEYAFSGWGLSVQKLSTVVARENRLASAEGVLVIGVQPAFPAQSAGLRPGDIVTKVNRVPIVSLEDMKAVYEKYEAKPEKVFVEVLRNHQVSYLVLKP